MPIYEYGCNRCGEVTEVLQRVNEAAPSKCPKCGGKVARVVSRSSFQLKGSGWYLTDYSSKGTPSKQESAPAPKCGDCSCDA